MYRHLFGPVPSRRLGISLGIDLVPMKTCTLDCIYCECGQTTDMIIERGEYVPLETVKSEYRHYLAHNPAPDYVTFSGSGEPTLNRRIGDIIRFIQARRQRVPVAVLTNGTLLFDPRVRKELKGAAVVIPSLDAATDRVFRKINRPHPQLNLNRIIEGLICFRKVFSGQLWLEVFIIPGLNDTVAELTALKQAIEKIAPDRVQLNTLDRPGTVNYIRAADRTELERVLDFWQLENTDIIAHAPDRRQLAAYREDAESAIIETIARRPCTLKDLTRILGLHTNEVNKYLDVLEADKKIAVVKQDRGFFYRLKQAG
jgi:wyosine [tRNA(Phe)-imidazoG37] synthetase (radical SAM superfamily)